MDVDPVGPCDHIVDNIYSNRRQVTDRSVSQVPKHHTSNIGSKNNTSDRSRKAKPSLSSVLYSHSPVLLLILLSVVLKLEAQPWSYQSQRFAKAGPGTSAHLLPGREYLQDHTEKLGEVVLVQLRLRMTGGALHLVDASLVRKERVRSLRDERLRGSADGKVGGNVRDDLGDIAVPADAVSSGSDIAGVGAEGFDARVFQVDNRGAIANKFRPLRVLAFVGDDEKFKTIAVRPVAVPLVELDRTT
jgi:hypothetical protein